MSSGTCTGCTLRQNPGARHTNFDFSYRLPRLRNWLTLYGDSVIHDSVSVLGEPQRAAFTFGTHLARFPGVPKLDLHVEGGTTDTLTRRDKGGYLYYWESVYRDAYTNKGNLMASWFGREGTGGQAWLTYWISPQSTIRIGYRTVQVSRFYVPQGLNQKDPYAEVNYQWQNGLGLQVMFQDERWAAPVLAPTPQHDYTAQVQISFTPKNWRLEKH